MVNGGQLDMIGTRGRKIKEYMKIIDQIFLKKIGRDEEEHDAIGKRYVA